MSTTATLPPRGSEEQPGGASRHGREVAIPPRPMTVVDDFGAERRKWISVAKENVRVRGEKAWRVPPQERPRAHARAAVLRCSTPAALLVELQRVRVRAAHPRAPTDHNDGRPARALRAAGERASRAAPGARRAGFGAEAGASGAPLGGKRADAAPPCAAKSPPPKNLSAPPSRRARRTGGWSTGRRSRTSCSRSSPSTGRTRTTTTFTAQT